MRHWLLRDTLKLAKISNCIWLYVTLNLQLNPIPETNYCLRNIKDTKGKKEIQRETG